MNKRCVRIASVAEFVRKALFVAAGLFVSSCASYTHSNQVAASAIIDANDGPPSNLACFLFFGQSNMAGRAAFDFDNHPEDFDVITDAWLFNDDNEFEPAQNDKDAVDDRGRKGAGFNRYSTIKGNSYQQLGPAYFFAKHFLEKAKTGRDGKLTYDGTTYDGIGIINQARGASYLWQWTDTVVWDEYPDSWKDQSAKGHIPTDETLYTLTYSTEHPDAPWSLQEFVAGMYDLSEQVRDMHTGTKEANFYFLQIPYFNSCFFIRPDDHATVCKKQAMWREGSPYGEFNVTAPIRSYGYNNSMFQFAQNPYVNEADPRHANNIYVVRSAGLPVQAYDPDYNEENPGNAARVHFNRTGMDYLGGRMADKVIENRFKAIAVPKSDLFHYGHDCFDPTFYSDNPSCALIPPIMTPNFQQEAGGDITVIPSGGYWGYGVYENNGEGSIQALLGRDNNGKYLNANLAGMTITSLAAANQLSGNSLPTESYMPAGDYVSRRMMVAAIVPPKISDTELFSTLTPEEIQADALFYARRDGSGTHSRVVVGSGFVSTLFGQAGAKDLLYVVELKPPYNENSDTQAMLWVELLNDFLAVSDLGGMLDNVVIKTPYAPVYVMNKMDELLSDDEIGTLFHRILWIPQVNDDEYYQYGDAPGITPEVATSSKQFVDLWQAQQKSVLAFETNYTNRSDTRLQPVVIKDETTEGAPIAMSYYDLLQYIAFTAERRSGVYAAKSFGPRGTPDPWANWKVKDTLLDMRGDPFFVAAPPCGQFLVITTERPDEWDDYNQEIGSNMLNKCKEVF